MPSRPVRGGGGDAPPDGADTRHQLAEAKRLHHVVVGAELEQQHAIKLFAARRQHDDRNVRTVAQHAADVGAVDVGKSEIEQHEIHVVYRMNRRLSGGRDRDGESLAVESFAQRLDDVVVVLDDEESRPTHGFHMIIVTSLHGAACVGALAFTSSLLGPNRSMARASVASPMPVHPANEAESPG